MAKFYKVIKDHPTWEVGAILSNQKDSDRYYPISDLWVKDIEGVDENWYEGKQLVENQTEWFTKVYEHKLIGKVKYLSKSEAQKLYKEQYK